MKKVLVKLADPTAQAFEDSGLIVQKKKEVAFPETKKLQDAIRMGVLIKIKDVETPAVKNEPKKDTTTSSNTNTGGSRGK